MMNAKNQTLATEFILLGFSDDLRTNVMLFVVFLLIYLVSANANGIILYLILLNTNLHIPMYFFLCILSVMDLCITSSVIPKFLADLLSEQKLISLAACTAQFYFAFLIGGTECLLLVLMAYDRYVAICRPLHYPVLMRWSNCYRLTALVGILSFMVFVLPALGNPVKLCYPNQINHFMCELLAVIQLACEDIQSSESFIVMTCFLALFLPFLLIMVSYISILFTVFKMRSAARAKAFSTCTSHVMVVIFFYGSSVVMYFGPSSKHSKKIGKYLSLLAYIFCPTLNPLIYCLNNKDIKAAQRKVLTKICGSFSIKKRLF